MEEFGYQAVLFLCIFPAHRSILVQVSLLNELLGLFMDSRYTIRTMRPDEIDFAVKWAAREGWNPGLKDAESFAKIDPNGWLIGELDGMPIATISGVKYGDQFAFVGFYIVAPEHRHHGYGIPMCDKIIEYIDGVVMGTDAVVEQQDNYSSKYGLQTEYLNIRYGGSVNEEFNVSEHIVDIYEVSSSDLNAYDKEIFLFDRAEFLKSWIDQPGGAAVAYVRDGMILGYAVLRPCIEGFKIAPLFADNPIVANEILRALFNKANGQKVFLDAPGVHSAAMDLAREYGLKPVFETARMYLGEPPKFDLHRVFAGTTAEVG